MKVSRRRTPTWHGTWAGHIVREQVAAGASDRQVLDWMAARYGDFVRLSPPFGGVTAFLWRAPVIALAVGFASLIILFRRRRIFPSEPLTEEERKRLARFGWFAQ